MKTAALRSQRRAPVRISRPEPEQDDFFDFKYVCELAGPARQFEELKLAFESVGYVIRKTEVFPHDFPYVVLRLDCTTAPRFSTATELSDHVRDMIESVRIRVPRDSLSVDRTGNRLLVVFRWDLPAPGSLEAMEMDELLAMLP